MGRDGGDEACGGGHKRYKKDYQRYKVSIGAHEIRYPAGRKSWWNSPLIRSYAECIQAPLVCNQAANDLSFLTFSRDDDFRENKLMEEDIPFIQDELDNVTTIIYLVIEGVRNDPVTLEYPRAKLRM